MSEPSDTAEGTGVCWTCGGLLDAGRFARMHASVLFTFCSEACLKAGTRLWAKRRTAARLQQAKALVIGSVFIGACLTPHEGHGPRRMARVARAAIPPAPTMSAARPTLPPGWFGPDWPPTDDNLLAALGRDAWVHPLAGPVRRMPLRDSRVFGAVRPGDRAVECRNGHCGVDLGGEIWGEHVHAVHDGIVEFVQRGPNAQHGGSFVRIAHRGGSVITQYFHLAAIPRWLERGTAVKCGDVVGLVGDTGVKESAPHLHFSISIRSSPDRPEKYFDPEPLIALWPLRVPLDGSERGLVTLQAHPGVPLGSMPWVSGRKRKGAKPGRGAASAAAGGGESAAAASDEEEASSDQPSPPEVPSDE
jgi:murein DD-endopeptidase MepM/ murein hydrolase activator NlpD